MLVKTIAIVIAIAILVSLGSALFYLLHRNHDPRALAKALTFRIGLSLLLFCFILIAFTMGWIQPHGI